MGYNNFAWWNKTATKVWNQRGKSEFEIVTENCNFGKFLNNKSSIDLKLH